MLDAFDGWESMGMSLSVEIVLKSILIPVYLKWPDADIIWAIVVNLVVVSFARLRILRSYDVEKKRTESNICLSGWSGCANG